MDYVNIAVPFFLLLIAIEIGWGVWRGRNTYRVNDSLNSLSLGTLSTLTKLVVLDIGMVAFEGVRQNAAVFDMDLGNPWHWVAGVLLYDFCYYWFHRISHERIIFWGAHVVHHQSEDFNLSTALRQTSTGVFITWVFYVPLFFLGMPIEMYVSIASLHLIYQFWIHTQFVPKLGFLEWFMITPSNHRVHHAQNPRYVDRNYGGLLCVWDRLFGTFAEECDEEPIIYGITTPLNTWNPVWANVHIYAGILRDAWYTHSWADKGRVFVARTGWRPADVAEQFPSSKADLEHFHKYDPPMTRTEKGAVLIQYLLATVAYFWLVTQAPSLSMEVRVIGVLLVLAALVSVGMVADHSPRAWKYETLRWCLTAVALMGAYGLSWIDAALFGAAGGFLIASAVVASVALRAGPLRA